MTRIFAAAIAIICLSKAVAPPLPPKVLWEAEFDSAAIFAVASVKDAGG